MRTCNIRRRQNVNVNDVVGSVIVIDDGWKSDNSEPQRRMDVELRMTTGSHEGRESNSRKS